MNTTMNITEGSTSTGSCKLEDIVDGIREIGDIFKYPEVADMELHNLIFEFDDIPKDRSISDTDISELKSFVFDEICERLDELAPVGLTFGAHECDGADYGFWSMDV